MEVNVEIETTQENCQDFVDKIHREEYERRLQLMQKYGVSNLKELQDEGVEINRTLWIIDEAADIILRLLRFTPLRSLRTNMFLQNWDASNKCVS